MKTIKQLIRRLDSVKEDDVLNPRKILLFTDYRMDTLFKFNAMSGVVDKLTHKSYNFSGLRTTQVYKDLYAFT